MSWRRHCAIVLVVLALSQPASAYLHFGVRAGGRQITLKWTQMPVRYFISDRATVPGVGVADFQAAVGRAFATWESVPSASIAYQFGGFTAANPGDEDGLSTLGFRDRPDL